MRTPILLFVVLLALPAVAQTADENSASLPPSFTTDPEKIVTAKHRSARIRISGFAGTAPVRSAVNVGEVTDTSTEGQDVVVTYSLPSGRHPRRLCLIVWEDTPQGKLRVVRVPLYGRTKIPVRTRAHSTVEVKVGEQAFGPVLTGRSGRARVPVLVPPGASHAIVMVTDKAELTSSKRVRIRGRRYPQIAVAAKPSRTTAEKVSVQIVIAAADPGMQDVAIEAGAESLDVAEKNDRRWETTWVPPQRPDDGDHELIATARRPGRRRKNTERKVVKVTVAAPGSDIAIVSKQTPSSRPIATMQSPATTRQLFGLVGVSAGFEGNLGALFAPRIAADGGIELHRSWGIIGARVGVAVSWASQQIAGTAPIASAESSLLLVPITLGVTYRYPLSIVSPYISPAFVAQLVRTRNAAEGLDETIRYDLALGVSLAAGACRQLGPGWLFAELGYLWSQLDNADVEVLAGGLFLGAGYRLQL